MRWLTILFWSFIGVMLLWQFYDYNARMSKPTYEQQQADKHYYFYNTNAAPAAATTSAPANGADVRQVSYSFDDHTPVSSDFVSHVTVKNFGTAKAVNVQLFIRPYRGTSRGDIDAGHCVVTVIDENSPLSQFGQWVSFPDLAPGDSASEDATFSRQSGGGVPGMNPRPQITFQTAK